MHGNNCFGSSIKSMSRHQHKTDNSVSLNLTLFTTHKSGNTLLVTRPFLYPNISSLLRPSRYSSTSLTSVCFLQFFFPFLLTLFLRVLSVSSFFAMDIAVGRYTWLASSAHSGRCLLQTTSQESGSKLRTSHQGGVNID